MTESTNGYEPCKHVFEMRGMLWVCRKCNLKKKNRKFD